jgi:hypothetical protein
MIFPGGFSPRKNLFNQDIDFWFIQGIYIIMSKKFTIQAKRIKVSLALFACLLFQPAVFSQLTVSIDQQHQCENIEILVPVLVSDFIDVASFQLQIQINTNNLEFIELVNKHALLGSSIGNQTIVNGNIVISIAWQAGLPSGAVSIDSGKLFDLKLQYFEGTANMILRDDCEIALSDLSVVDDPVLNDGFVEPVEIRITSQPQDQTVYEDKTAHFSLEQTGAIAYQWQYSAGNGWSNLSDNAFYSGVITSELTITNVPLDINDYRFRCVALVNDDCSLASDEAVLSVMPLGINNLIGQTPGLKVYPNPFNDKLNYVLESPSGSIGLRMLNLLGKTVYQSLTIDYDKGSVGNILTYDLQPGLYFLQLLSDDAVLVTVKVLKK